MSNVIKRFGSKMLVLSDKEVRQCLSMKDCLEINRDALMCIASPKSAAQVGGTGNVPSRLGLPGPKPKTSTESAEDWTLFKPAAFYAHENNINKDGSKDSLMGLKIVSIRSQNPCQGLPLVPASIMLLDAASGIVKAVMNGTYLTGARTAASSGLATQLARPDLNHLVVFGAGLQAECHIQSIETAIGRVIPKITIVNRTYERAKSLGDRINCEQCDVVLLNDTEAINKALSTADVVAATTNATKPLFDGSVLKPGTHINGIGSYTPDMQEIPSNAVNRSRILIDTPDAKTVGDLKHLQEGEQFKKHPMTLLGDALADPVGSGFDVGTESSTDSQYDCTFYKGVGTAIQDVMTAQLVVMRAQALGIGTEVDMS